MSKETVIGVLVDPLVTKPIIDEFLRSYYASLPKHPKPYMNFNIEGLKYILINMACDTAVDMHNRRPDEPIEIRNIYMENSFWDEVDSTTTTMLEDELEQEDGSMKPQDEIDKLWQENTTVLTLQFAEQMAKMIVKDIKRQLVTITHQHNIGEFLITHIDITNDTVIVIYCEPEEVEETP